MAAPVPVTMRSLVAPRYCSPAEYEVIELPVPKIERADQVLIKMHAAAVNSFDPQVAAGVFKLVGPPVAFPMKIGTEGAGVIVSIGGGVKSFSVGDAVERLLLPKQANVSFEEAAALSSAVVAAVQCANRALELMGEPGGKLAGKSIFMPAALGATGSAACQVLRNAYGADRLMTSVSTPKAPLVKELLPGCIDEVVDYQTQDVVRTVGAGTVDLLLDTQSDLVKRPPLVKPKSGVVITIAAVPTPELCRQVMGSLIPFWVLWLASLAPLYYRWKLRGTGIKMEFVSGNPNRREDLEKAGEIIALGKVKPITNIISWQDLDAVKDAINKVWSGNGGLGKLVIKIEQ